MKKDFNKKQILRSKSGVFVMSDGTGLHTVLNTDYLSFSGVCLFDPSGAYKCGDFCKSFNPDLFEEVDFAIFDPR